MTTPVRIDFPWHFDPNGRTATTSTDDHIRDMIEQLLFTSPGERVNRPDFGSGVLQLIFAPNSPELAAALQFAMRAALQRWLGDLIEVQDLAVASLPSREALRDVFGLTDREADFAIELVRCGNLERAAARARMAFNTARNHLQNISRKTGASGQTEVALLLGRLG